MKRLRILCLGVTFLFASFGDAASADFSRHHDANDAHGRLDVRSVSAGHGARPGVVVHTLKTYGPWKGRVLTGDNVYISFALDSKRNEQGDYRLVWIDFSKRKGLYARIRGVGVDSPAGHYGDGRVWRPNRRSVKVAFSTRDLPKALRDGYLWRAWTSYERAGSQHCEPNGTSTFPWGKCRDWSPRLDSWYHHHL